MALIDQNVKPYLANNLVANYDENGDGTGVNGQPLQVTFRGGLQSSPRLEIEQLQGTFSAQRLDIRHDEIGTNLEQMRSDLYTQMITNGYVYCYNYSEYICVDSITPNRYNLYSCAWLSNF
jgi:hypothetical protein